MKGDISFIEKNAHGAYVIWGRAGIRQYYFYSKKEAIRLYKEECRKIFICQPAKEGC